MARTRNERIGGIVRIDYLEGSISDDCEIEVSVAERLAIDRRNLHFVGGISAEAVGEEEGGGFCNDRGEAKDEDGAYSDQ